LLEARAAALAAGFVEAFEAAGVTATVPVLGPLVGLFFGPSAPVDYDGARTTDEKAYAAFFHAMLDQGVALAPGAYEIAFPGLAHTEDVTDQVRTAAIAAAGSLA
jgi:glutamate-1-semialdehyde 2,1-aminomutase